jgi:two-component system LytT family response regulator
MLKAVIIDDEQESINGLRIKLATTCPEVQIIAEFTDPGDAVPFLTAAEVDVVFLDVEMPDMNGFTLLDTLSRRNFEVIMVTAYSDYALNAIKANALDYLLKPVDNDDLRIAVNKVITKRDSNKGLDKKIDDISRLLRSERHHNEKIMLPSAREVHFVQVGQIIRVAGENNYSVFYLSNGSKITVTKTLKDYEGVLTQHRFFRVHKSHIINPDYLVKFNKGDMFSVIMTDGSEIEVSVRRKADFLKLMEGLSS